MTCRSICTAAAGLVKPVLAFKEVINLWIFRVMNELLSCEARLKSWVPFVKILQEHHIFKIKKNIFLNSDNKEHWFLRQLNSYTLV